jgi:hypothetical protein
MTTLLEEPTRAFARPVILLLSNGFLQLGQCARLDHPNPDEVAVVQFGSPQRFVPQKAIAKKRLMAVAGAAAAAVSLLAAALVRMVL